MPGLHELQAGFARTILTGNASAIAAAIRGDDIPAAARLAIYRNHFRMTLADALTATFPVVRRLVGADFFAAMARRFIDAAPPTAPCLTEYGADLPEFLAAMPECAGLPYLADMARFEWLVNQSATAADAAGIDPAALAALPAAQLPALRLRLHHGATPFGSAYPITRIWQANQPGAADEIIDLASGGCRLLVMRRDGDVAWRDLDADEFAFVSALHGGLPLGGCVDQAMAASGLVFDFAAALARLLRDRAIIEIIPGPANDGVLR